MRKIVFLLIVFFQVCAMMSQVIPPEMQINWKNALQDFEIIYSGHEANVRDFGAIGNGSHDDSQAVMDAIQSLEEVGGVVFFPSGDYLITQSLSLSNNIFLKGISSDSSALLFELGSIGGHCIQLVAAQSAEFIRLDEGYSKDSYWVFTDSAFLFEAGDYAELLQDNGDWDIAPISWAQNVVGQMLQIDRVSGDSLFFTHALRYSYSADLHPRIRWVNPIQNTGISCLKIKRMDQVLDQAGSNIYYNFAVNSLVEGVESDSSVGSHISIHHSSNIHIKGSYFHHGFTYDGTGTRGYGVSISHHSGQCLISNNIFKYLRHAMMVKTGANGNVFSYNYSREPIRSEPIPDASGDISLHGHYAYANLFEHNIIQNIIIDHYWGPSGPYNTLFRNRAELYGVLMTTNNEWETTEQNFVGNETTDTSPFHGQYFLTGSGHFEYGNNILGVTTPPATSDLSDSSYYLDQAPDFWPEASQWPSIGYPNELNSGSIPAHGRYLLGEHMTICPDSIPTHVLDFDYGPNDIHIWPNPASGSFKCRASVSAAATGSLSIYDSYGRLVQQQIISFSVPDAIHQIKLRPETSTGLYLIVLTHPKGRWQTKLLIETN